MTGAFRRRRRRPFGSLSRASLLPPGPLFRVVSPPQQPGGDSAPRTEVHIPEQEYLEARYIFIYLSDGRRLT